MTDRQTDRRTDYSAIAMTREALQLITPNWTVTSAVSNVVLNSYLPHFVIFVASYLAILSHSVCDFGLVISAHFCL